MAISIDLGFKSYEIQDTDGNVVGEIRFNPSDPGLIGRWETAQARLQELTEHEPENPEEIAALDAEVKAMVDTVFGAPISGVLFRGISSLALCANGHLVIENVFEALTPIIKDACEKASKASQARVDKYAKKYEGSKAGLAPEQKK